MEPAKGCAQNTRDNVGALFLVVKMRPPNATTAIVARELALRLAELSFPPDAIRTPGVAHVLADRLSRVYAPGGPGKVDKTIHPALQDAQLTEVPERNSSWYRTSEARLRQWVYRGGRACLQIRIS